VVNHSSNIALPDLHFLAAALHHEHVHATHQWRSPAAGTPSSKNLAFVSRFVEIPEDVVFTVEYSVRVAQMAVYELLGITREIPPILHHDRSVKGQFDWILKAFR
jgi:myosin-crossreactive antigen